MSTKTNFKRIALVAVAALGMGVLSSVPSQAGVTGLTLTVANGTALAGKADSSNAAVISVAGLVDVGVGDSLTVTFIAKDITANTSAVARMQYLDTTTSAATGTLVSSTRGAQNLAVAVGSGAGASDSKTAAAAPFVVYHQNSAAYVGARFIVQLDSLTAGLNTAGVFTYTALASAYNGATLISSTSADFTITIAALTSASTTPSATYTNAFIGSTSPSSADAELSPKLATASTTAAGYVSVYLKNASNIADIAKDTITVTITGAGLVGDGTAYSKSLSGFQTGTKTYSIVPDGTSGISTITIKTSITGQTWVKTMNFYSATLGSIAAANFHPVLNVGTNDGAVAVTAKDSTGNSFTGSLWIYASSATDALVAGSTTPVACNAWNSTTGILCNVATLTGGTAKLKVIDAATVATAKTTSNEVTVTVSNGTASTVKLAFDKATYAPGEKALLTVTPVSATGTNLGTGTWANLLASGGITSSMSFGSGSDSTTTAVSITTSAYSSATSNLVAGAKTYVVYMPVNGGTVKVTATGGTSLPVSGQVAVSATATVTDSGAAALAAVTALATTVASLKTLITTLTNLVLKIQKKVKA
jgi:hypothetical protein